MPEPFKNAFNAELASLMGDVVLRAYPAFDRAGFVAEVTAGLDALELKGRSDLIAAALAARLPDDFGEAARILVAALHPEKVSDDHVPSSDDRGLRGWAVMPLAEVVALRGADELETSMAALKQITSRFSAEFAIRPFLRDRTEATLAILHGWLGDPDRHVRRLVSEGTRPRLPWGLRLQRFVDDPAPLIPLLTALRDDPSDYVRRSVANSLNDIAKDHPALVVDLCADWWTDAPEPRRKLIRHALRTLVKQGDEAALAVLGFAPLAFRRAGLSIATPVVRLGDKLEFALELVPDADGEAILDYVVHHVRANGARSPKVFKWTTVAFTAGERWSSGKAHPIRPVTTRRYYPGEHLLQVTANGVVVGEASFELEI